MWLELWKIHNRNFRNINCLNKSTLFNEIRSCLKHYSVCYISPWSFLTATMSARYNYDYAVE